MEHVTKQIYNYDFGPCQQTLLVAIFSPPVTLVNFLRN